MRIQISRSPVPFLIMILFAAGLIWIWWFESRKVLRANSFSPATAVITSTHYSTDADTNDQFYYEGTIAETNTTFRSFRISYGNINSEKSYKEFIENSPVGSTKEVFVSPSEPPEVIARRGELSFAFRMILIIGIITMIAGLIGLARALFAMEPAMPNKSLNPTSDP